jgi:hypothetical protein
MNNADFKSLHLRVLKALIISVVKKEAPQHHCTMHCPKLQSIDHCPKRKKSEICVAVTESGTEVVASRGTKAARRASVYWLISDEGFLRHRTLGVLVIEVIVGENLFKVDRRRPREPKLNSFMARACREKAKGVVPMTETRIKRASSIEYTISESSSGPSVLS